MGARLGRLLNLRQTVHLTPKLPIFWKGKEFLQDK